MKIEDALTIILNAVDEAKEKEKVPRQVDWFSLVVSVPRNLEYRLWDELPVQAAYVLGSHAQVLPAIKNAFERCEDQEGLVDAYFAVQKITGNNL